MGYFKRKETGWNIYTRNIVLFVYWGKKVANLGVFKWQWRIYVSI